MAKTLEHKRYLVVTPDPLKFLAPHPACPEDDYARTLAVVSADNPMAVKTSLINFQTAFGILPATPEIRETAQKIQKGNVIRVSGNHYEVAQVLNNGVKEPKTFFAGKLDVFQLNELKIEK